MNNPLPDCSAEIGLPAITGGGWLVALSQSLTREGAIELGVASRVAEGKSRNIVVGRIQHFTVPAPNKGYGLFRPTANMIRRYQEIVRQFSPDVIHVHGTEWYGGLVTVENGMGQPAIVSLQGLITHHRRHLFGQLGFLDILKARTLREWLTFSGLWKQRMQWNKRAVIEGEIIRRNRVFIGRTLWDRAHLRQINPDAIYFHCDEMVRREFSNQEWNLSTATRHTIFAPSASYPLKGFHLLVQAVAILKQEFPDIKVRVPLAGFDYPAGVKGLYARMRGDGYANYLAGLIKNLNVEELIVPLNELSATKMADEMKNAHVFALTSFVENSPNTMAEALSIGVPCVVSLAGGIPSLIDDMRNVLGFPIGDEAVLAEQIRKIFRDDNLAKELSKAARETAHLRHSPGRIVQRMVAIYRAAARAEYSNYLEMPPKPR